MTVNLSNHDSVSALVHPVEHAHFIIKSDVAETWVSVFIILSCLVFASWNVITRSFGLTTRTSKKFDPGIVLLSNTTSFPLAFVVSHVTSHVIEGDSPPCHNFSLNPWFVIHFFWSSICLLFVGMFSHFILNQFYKVNYRAGL